MKSEWSFAFLIPYSPAFDFLGVFLFFFEVEGRFEVRFRGFVKSGFTGFPKDLWLYTFDLGFRLDCILFEFYESMVILVPAFFPDLSFLSTAGFSWP